MYYFQWNKALYDYYFGSDAESVVLYVDDDIINSIGREYGLPQVDESYLKSFLSSTILEPDRLSLVWLDLVNRDVQNSFILKQSITDNERVSFRRYLSEHYLYNGGGDVNELSNYLLDVTNSNRKLLSCPLYLAFMISVILAAQHQPLDERAMHNAILRYLNGGNEYGFSADIMQTLARDFALYAYNLNRFNNAFDATKVRNQYVNIGIIIYHLMLSKNERDRIHELLFRHRLNRWDEDNIPYSNIINRYVLPNLRQADRRLRDTLYNPLAVDVIKNTLRKYSYAEYQGIHAANERIEDFFYYILNIEDDPPILSLGTMYTESGSNDQLVLRGSEYGAECNFYQVRTRQPLRWGVDYRYESDNVRIRTLNYNDLAFFEEMPNSRVYIQVEGNKIVPNRNYLVVIPQNQADKNILAQITRRGVDHTRYYADIFPGSNVRYIQNLFGILNIDHPVENQKAAINLPFDELPGITSPGHRNNYYYNGLKYYHIENYNPDDSYEVECVDDSDENNHINATTSITPGGDVFVDLPRDDNASNWRYRFTLKKNGEPFSNEKVYNIIAELGRPQGECLNHFKFDGWARRISDTQHTNYYSNGNILTDEEDSYDIAHGVMEADLYNAVDGDFLLSDLISAIGEDEHEWIDDQTLLKVIRYVATRKGFPLLSNEKVSKIKSAMMELGYLDRAFDEHLREIYQVNDLRIVPSTKQFSEGNDAFLLFGGCTGKRRREIWRVIETNGLQSGLKYKLPYDDSQVMRMPYLTVLPPFMLVDRRTAEQLSIHLGIERRDLWNINGFVNFIKGIVEFENEFLGDNLDAWTEYERAQLDLAQLPRFVDDPDLGRIRLETVNGKCTHYYYNQRRIPIPSDLIRLYCQNSHNQPVIIVDELENPEDRHYNKVYFEKEMGIPYLLKRLFCTLNLGLQQEEYAFFVDNLCDAPSRKQWYSTIRCYDVSGISDPLLRRIIGKLSSCELNDDLTLNDSVIVKETNLRYSMKLYQNQMNYAERYMCLFNGETVLACSELGNTREIYVRNVDVEDPGDFGAFYRVFNRKNDDYFVNNTFSGLIKFDVDKYISIQRRDDFERDWIRDFPPSCLEHLRNDFNETEITIIERTNL